MSVLINSTQNPAIAHFAEGANLKDRNSLTGILQQVNEKPEDGFVHVCHPYLQCTKYKI